MTVKQMRAIADFAEQLGELMLEAGNHGLSFPAPLTVHVDDGIASFTVWVGEDERVQIDFER